MPDKVGMEGGSAWGMELRREIVGGRIVCDEGCGKAGRKRRRVAD